MNNKVKAAKADVWPVVSKAFPEYKGRKFVVETTERITFYDTNWAGGTRNQYVLVRLADGAAKGFDAPAPWVNAVEGKTVDMVPGFAVVEHTIFQGKDCGIRVHAHPSDMASLLPWFGKITITLKHPPLPAPAAV